METWDFSKEVQEEFTRVSLGFGEIKKDDHVPFYGKETGTGQ